MIVTTYGKARSTASLTAFSSLVRTRCSCVEVAELVVVTAFECPKIRLTAAPATAPAMRAAKTASTSELRPNRLGASPSSIERMRPLRPGSRQTLRQAPLREAGPFDPAQRPYDSHRRKKAAPSTRLR